VARLIAWQRGRAQHERNGQMRPLFTSAAIGVVLVSAATAASAAGAFNQYGNILISDQFNNRVIEVTPLGQIVWQFGLGPNDVTKTSPVGVNDALRVANLTLISGTGAPAGTEPKCPSGCPDNRVMFVDQSGKIVWQYGTFGVTGAGFNQLNAPVQATFTPSRTVFITDQGNQRVIEVALNKNIVWQYGMTGVSGSGAGQLNNPNSAELLANGDVLIADESNNRVIEVNHAKQIVATFTIGGTANGVAFASRLANGDTLITDSNNNRVVEVDSHDKTVWSYATNTQTGSNANPAPTRAVRTFYGATLISDQFNHRVIKVRGNKTIAIQYGNLNTPGFGLLNTRQGLNAPYDAKVIGDNTGLTFFEAGAAKQFALTCCAAGGN
jgi:hypothetical protein